MKVGGDRGDWDFSMAPTYVVAITNFSFPEEVREMDSRHQAEARNLKAMGLSLGDIAKATGLTVEELATL